jgi:hypothetical protein
MARFPERWQFGDLSTSDLDQGQGGICRPHCIGRRQKFHPGRRRFARATNSGVTSGLSRTRDVRCWHLADIDGSSQVGEFASHCRSPTKLPSITRGKVRRARPSILHIEQRTTGRPVSQGRFTARRDGFSRQMHHCIPRSHATALGYPSVTPVQPIRHCVDKQPHAARKLAARGK